MMKLDNTKTGMVLLADREQLLKIIFEDDLNEYYSMGEIESQRISYVSSDWIDPQNPVSKEIIKEAKSSGGKMA